MSWIAIGSWVAAFITLLFSAHVLFDINYGAGNIEGGLLLLFLTWVLASFGTIVQLFTWFRD